MLVLVLLLLLLLLGVWVLVWVQGPGGRLGATAPKRGWGGRCGSLRWVRPLLALLAMCYVLL